MTETESRLLTSADPAAGATIETFTAMGPQQVASTVAEACRASRSWAALSLDGRAVFLKATSRGLRAMSDRLAGLITREMGKPLVEAEAEIEKCAWACAYFAENAERFLADEPFPSDAPNSFVTYEPLGVVLAIMPWNYPLWQVFRCAAPALMAGNTMLLKHAPNVTRCALEIEAVFREAGMPDGVFQTLVTDLDGVDRLIDDPRISAVTLTGSTWTGARVAERAGRNTKKTVLELGGSDAFIVLEDADIARAAETAARSRFQNCGQSCIAAKRFIVVDSVAADFEDRLVALAAAIRVGDPMDPQTQMGPMAREDLRDKLEGQLRRSLDGGATLRTGGRRLDRPGWFFPPTVVTGCTPDMAAFTEETFGPLAAVMRVRDADEAVDVANSSPYGLGGNVWTADIERGVALARRVESGGVFINGMTHSDPRLPFGGVKGSGYGRELSVFGMREFVNVKTIWHPGV